MKLIRNTFPIMLIIFLFPMSLWAGELVDGKYVQASGQEISLELTIKTPPPSSIILTQKLPKGIAIMSSSPQLKKSNPKQGEAKWLLKHPKPGTLTVNMTLDKPIKAGRVSGTIRYKDPRKGRMVNMQVRP